MSCAPGRTRSSAIRRSYPLAVGRQAERRSLQAVRGTCSVVPTDDEPRSTDAWDGQQREGGGSRSPSLKGRPMSTSTTTTPRPAAGPPKEAVSDNLTARAARWSASHRKAAVLGWLAFVFAAFALGNALGTVTLKSQDQGNGESRVANQVLGRQFPRDRAGEQVLIQSHGGPLAGA